MDKAAYRTLPIMEESGYAIVDRYDQARRSPRVGGPRLRRLEVLR
jgi:hypothetical protein